MRPSFRPQRWAPPAGAAPAPRLAGRAIPFDHAARFELTGLPGNVVEAVVNVEPDAVFVASAVSYGFEADRSRPLALAGAANVAPRALTLAALPAMALVEGFRVNPRSENLFFAGDVEVPRRARSPRALSQEPVTQPLADKLLERLEPERPLSFLFSMLDSASGRELQAQPTHSLASLGRSDGQRPFRPLAPPVSFLPRSTVRLQVIERTPGAVGTLHVVLSGYQVLIGRDGGAPRAAAAPAPRAPGAASVPFDHVARLQLVGRPGNVVQRDVTVDTDGTFVVTAMGYGLDPGDPRVFRQDLAGGTQDLRTFPLAAFTSDALSLGLRVRPALVRFAFPDGNLATAIPTALAAELFEVLNAPEDVSFRYQVLDTATGRGWQNQAVHNLAGLGSADGVRPFKRLARPVGFGPRTTFRVTVEEVSGRGELFLAFHGFKVLDGGRGGRP